MFPQLSLSGVQRGSIKFASCPGNAQLSRYQELCGIDDITDALPSIPVMPLSYGNAEILFRAMTDSNDAPSDWQGGINVSYKVESELLSIELSVETDLRTDDITQNVYGIIDGEEYPDQIVMIGAHRDGWVCGAQDDISGTVTILEVAKGFGDLYASVSCQFSAQYMMNVVHFHVFDFALTAGMETTSNDGVCELGF